MKIILVIIFSFIFSASSLFAGDVKEADLAGSWYPDSSRELSDVINKYLNDAYPEKIDFPIIGIISPHAGYQFSGSIAAYGYKLLIDRPVKTVILVGFSHRKQLDAIAIYDRGEFSTPIGSIPVDEDLAGRIKSFSSRIVYRPDIFDDENSIEMQLPFIKAVFPRASIVSIAFGTQNYQDAVLLSDALAAVLKSRDDCLIVASTDLSHFFPYEDANKIDTRFITILEAMNPRELFDNVQIGSSEACGIMPVVSTILTAQKLGYNNVKILKYANSGDTFYDKSKVVGYLSAAFYNISGESKKLPGSASKEKTEGSMLLNSIQKKRLLDIARESIVSFVKNGKRKSFNEKDPVLNEPMGAFVILHENGQLRGCIGNIIGRGPLYKTVSDMAIEAATADPRFRKLSPDEIDKIDLEISVLSPLKKVASANEIKIPGNGVLVRNGFSSGVYLPQVATETGWTKEEFLNSLCGEKAGMAPDAWKDPSTELYVFTALVFGEKDKL